MGRKTKNRISGVNLKWLINENVSVLAKGTKKIQTITSNTVYGKLIFLLTKKVQLAIKSNKRKDSVPVRKVIWSIITFL